MSKPSGRTKEVRDASISFSSANIKGAERMPFFRLRAGAFPAWRGDRWRGAGVEISRAAARYLLAARKICGARGREGRPTPTRPERRRSASACALSPAGPRSSATLWRGRFILWIRRSRHTDGSTWATVHRGGFACPAVRISFLSLPWLRFAVNRLGPRPPASWVEHVPAGRAYRLTTVFLFLRTSTN